MNLPEAEFMANVEVAGPIAEWSWPCWASGGAIDVKVMGFVLDDDVVSTGGSLRGCGSDMKLEGDCGAATRSLGSTSFPLRLGTAVPPTIVPNQPLLGGDVDTGGVRVDEGVPVISRVAFVSGSIIAFAPRSAVMIGTDSPTVRTTAFWERSSEIAVGLPTTVVPIGSPNHPFFEVAVVSATLAGPPILEEASLEIGGIIFVACGASLARGSTTIGAVGLVGRGGRKLGMPGREVGSRDEAMVVDCVSRGLIVASEDSDAPSVCRRRRMPNQVPCLLPDGPMDVPPFCRGRRSTGDAAVEDG